MEDIIFMNALTMTPEERARRAKAIDEAFFRADLVILRHEELFASQPNVFMVRADSIGRGPDNRAGIGVRVHVTEIVPQWKLPPQDRIPCVIDGVPVEITTADPRDFLGGASSRHRPLMAGIGVYAPNVRLPGTTLPFFGTLTGIARRNSDNSEVLVTCLHNLTGGRFQDLANGSEEMYQVNTDHVSDKIGTLLDWVVMSKDSGYTNVADVAICTPINPGPPTFPQFSDFANYELHNSGHDLGLVIAGTVEPKVGQKLTSVSAVSGVRTDVTVAAVDQSPTIGDYSYSGLVRLNVGQTPFQSGDSGTPLLVEVEPGKYRMCCVLFALSNNNTYAFPASVAEKQLGITFGKEITMPRLTTEGFVGQHWIIDDYFRAGETLHCGDVVVARQRATSPYLTRVFKATGSHEKRVVGIVHTPTGKEVGDQMATTGAVAANDEYVPVVVKGIAKTLSARSIGVGDPVMASGTSAKPTGKTNAVATVKDASTHNHTTVAQGAHSHTGCPGYTGAGRSQG